MQARKYAKALDKENSKIGGSEEYKYPHKYRIANPRRFFSFIALIVIIIIVVAVLLASSSGVRVLTSPIQVFISNGGYSYLKQGSSVFAVYVVNSTASGAYVYIAKLPLLYGFVSKVYMKNSTEVNVSVNAGRRASINIRMISSSSKGAMLNITPISSFYNIQTSNSVSLIGPVSIGTAASKGLKVIITSTTISTSTTTSTINQTNPLLVSAEQYANTNTSIGVLLNNYKALYIKDKACNASIYNETYAKYFNTQPPGFASFENASAQTPISITVSAKPLKDDLVLVNYTPVMRSGVASQPMVSLLLNMSPSAVVPIVSTLYEGILLGDNYTILNSTYQFQSSIQNYCGAYIPKP